ncbi:hypothetical protein [Amycolatopsis sp. NPDC059021]|uniref:hypothetical protein n=1 Tax=Amycolatopsis sp. NPDC059021 TaxID=3346704 RepID=UPI0036723E68
MTITAIWLIAAGAALLGTGFLFEITTPPHTGANIGSAGCFFLGLCATGMGLVLGVVATLAWLLGRRGDRHPPALLLAWEKRLRRSTIAAVGLITSGAIVLSWGTFVFTNQSAPAGMESAVIGMENAYPFFLAGLGITIAGLLAGTPPALYWWSRRRSGVDR